MTILSSAHGLLGLLTFPQTKANIRLLTIKHKLCHGMSWNIIKYGYLFCILMAFYVFCYSPSLITESKLIKHMAWSDWDIWAGKKLSLVFACLLFWEISWLNPTHQKASLISYFSYQPGKVKAITCFLLGIF